MQPIVLPYPAASRFMKLNLLISSECPKFAPFQRLYDMTNAGRFHRIESGPVSTLLRPEGRFPGKGSATCLYYPFRRDAPQTVLRFMLLSALRTVTISRQRCQHLNV